MSDEVVEEDSALCEQSMDRYLDMKSIRSKLMKEIKTEPSSETTLSHHLTTMQKEMQLFMIDTIKQQRNLLTSKKRKRLNCHL